MYIMNIKPPIQEIKNKNGVVQISYNTTGVYIGVSILSALFCNHGRRDQNSG